MTGELPIILEPNGARPVEFAQSDYVISELFTREYTGNPDKLKLEVCKRLQRVPDTTLGRAERVNRLRLTRTEAGVCVWADVSLGSSCLVIGAKAGSLRDHWRLLVQITFGLAGWLFLVGLVLALSGAPQSLAKEWAKRHGGNPQLVADVLKTGMRPTPDGLERTGSPRGSLELIVDDPAILMALAIPLTWSTTLVLYAVGKAPASAWDKLVGHYGVPTGAEMQRVAERLHTQVVEHLKRPSQTPADHAKSV